MARHSAHALRTTIRALALVVPIAACGPQTDIPVALAERAPAAATAQAPAAAPNAAAEPLPISRCGSERNPCRLEGITITARRQTLRG